MGRRRRKGGWNKGMKRYSKGKGRYGYYDPYYSGKPLGIFLILIGLVFWFAFPLNILPLIIGISFLAGK